MKNIFIRTLGGKDIGYGHYYRCLSLAKAIKVLAPNTQITFVINIDLLDVMKDTQFNVIVHNTLEEDYDLRSKLKIDLFILDTYLGDNGYLKKVKKQSKLMLIDDNNDIYDSTIPDIIYNGNIYADELGYRNIDRQIRLLGPRYLLMKEEYWYNGQTPHANKEGILITTGGSDENRVIIKVLETIQLLDTKIKVILGPGFKEEYISDIEIIARSNVELIYRPDSLKEYINSSNIVITAGGSSVYEVLTLRVIPILISIADNQDLMCKKLNNMGVEYLGKYPQVDYERLTAILRVPKYIKQNFDNEKIKLLDGKGARRVAKILNSLT